MSKSRPSDKMLILLGKQMKLQIARNDTGETLTFTDNELGNFFWDIIERTEQKESPQKQAQSLALKPELAHTHSDAKKTSLSQVQTLGYYESNGLKEALTQHLDPIFSGHNLAHQLKILASVYEKITADAYFTNVFHEYRIATHQNTPITETLRKKMLSCRKELLLWFGNPKQALLCEQTTYFPPEYLPTVAKPWKTELEKQAPDVKINARWQNPKSNTYLIDVVCKPQTQTSYLQLAKFFKPVSDRVVLDAKNQTVTIKGVNAPSNDKPDQFTKLSFPK